MAIFYHLHFVQYTLFIDIYKEEKQHNSSAIRGATWQIKENLLPLAKPWGLNLENKYLWDLTEKVPNLYSWYIIMFEDIAM